MTRRWDAVVVGSGPNGLAAAVVLARAGRRVLVVEGADTPGGGVRSAALTLPGFVHDSCSSVFPMAVAAPFLKQLPLADHGLAWVQPPVPVAHPMDDGSAVTLERSVDATAGRLGPDADAYRRLMAPLVASADALFADLLGPFRLPRRPLAAARFGWRAVRSGRGLAEKYFRTAAGRALVAGIAAHAVLPLERRPGAAIALMLALAGHVSGWPVVAGGAQRLTDALASYFRSLGGEIETGRTIRTIDKLPPAGAVLLDVTPRQVVALAGHRLPARYVRRLGRYRYGPGVFKVDWALSAPIPWAAAECRRAGTVHVGGKLEEIAAGERDAFEGRHSERPFVLFDAAEPVRPDPRPRRHAHGLGLLPRAQRLGGGHDNENRSPGRALRPGLS